MIGAKLLQIHEVGSPFQWSVLWPEVRSTVCRNAADLINLSLSCFRFLLWDKCAFAREILSTAGKSLSTVFTSYQKRIALNFKFSFVWFNWMLLGSSADVSILQFHFFSDISDGSGYSEFPFLQPFNLHLSMTPIKNLAVSWIWLVYELSGHYTTMYAQTWNTWESFVISYFSNLNGSMPESSSSAEFPTVASMS